MLLSSNSFFAQLAGDVLVPLRAAAAATHHWLHVFDMDANPPVCHVLPPWLKEFDVKGTFKRQNGSKKKVHVTGSAWSPILGKDVLPKQLEFSGMYDRNKVAVLLKQEGIYHSCVLMSGQKAVSAAELKKMSITFVTLTYVESRSAKKGRQPAQPGRKRGRPGKLRKK